MSQIYTARFEDQLRRNWIQRFDARYWQITASGVSRVALASERPDALHIQGQMWRDNDAVTLVWDSLDDDTHMLLRRVPDCDLRGLLWSFDWRASGVAGQIHNGQVQLILEGRDEQGNVFQTALALRDYAQGLDGDAHIRLDFDALYNEQNHKIWAGHIERLSIKIGTGLDGSKNAWLTQPQSCDIWLRNMRVDGAQARIEKGDAFMPRHPHGLVISYDDVGHCTPAALIETIEALGFQKKLIVDIGRAYFYPFAAQSAQLDLAANSPHGAAMMWVNDLAMRAATAGLSLAFMLGPQISRDAIAHDEVLPISWLTGLAHRLLDVAQSSGHAACLYLRDFDWKNWSQDQAQFVKSLQARGHKPQLAMLVHAQTLQGVQENLGWSDAWRDLVEMICLQIDGTHGASPYIWRLLKNYVSSRAISCSIFYDVETPAQWRDVSEEIAIYEKADVSVAIMGFGAVSRAGLCVAHIEQEKDNVVNGFDDVDFPLDVAGGFQLAPQYQTQVVRTASGSEYRNALWAYALARYDAAAGVRSRSDMDILLRFFHARKGRAVAFRLRDPLDHNSSPDGAAITPQDQIIGVGDGRQTHFQLVKLYQQETPARPILLPRVRSVRIAFDGVVQNASVFLISDIGGVVVFHRPPPSGVVVSAGFEFDVPVRFEQDHIDLELQQWQSGVLPTVPMIEVRNI